MDGWMNEWMNGRHEPKKKRKKIMGSSFNRWQRNDHNNENNNLTIW